MNSSVSAQTQSQTSRTLIESFENEFAQLDSRTRELLRAVSDKQLYQPVSLSGVSSGSVGELMLRSAGAVEQTFGGLTSNLWDDPFEWTLPENLSTPTLITEYLNEVRQTRSHFFARLQNDADLTKLIAVPAGGTQPLTRLLLETLVRAAGHLERATVTLALSQASSPEV